MAQIIIKGIEGIRGALSGKKILLVKDSSYKFLDVKVFFDDIPHTGFSEFTPNPLYEQIVEGIQVFHDNGCDTIVAVGGGSAIDVAKCIKLFCKMNPSINYLEQETFNTDILLIAIPTTAGTGSESTQHAVIYYEGIKQSISHASIVPDIAVLEPSVLKTLPVYQKKCTMLDALCQGIESWWSVNSNNESKDYSRQAVEIIRDNWKEYIEENNPKAAEKIMEAANFGGRAINITATTAAHAMSYKLTSLFNLPHGHAVAVCLPAVWRYMLEHTDKCIDNRGEAYLKETFEEISVSLCWFEELIKQLKITYPVSENRMVDIDALSKSVNPERLKNNPVALDKETLKSMYEVIVK